MSRFFADNSESDSYSSESESDVEVQVDNHGGNRFEFDSSSSEEEKRVVRSARDKRYDAMHKKIDTIKDNLKATPTDWIGVKENLQDLNKLLAKAKNIVAREGIPKFYIKAILTIQEQHAEFIASKEKTNSSNTKAVNILKQIFRKWDKQYAAAVEAYKQNPLVSEEEKSEVDSEFSDDDISDTPLPDAKSAGEGDDSEDWDSDNLDSLSDSSSDDSDSDAFNDMDDMPAGGAIYTREYWMKKPKDLEKEKSKKLLREQRRRERAERRKQQKKVKVVEKKEEKVYTPEMILKKLKDLLSMRGKRGTNRKTMIADLELLSSKATDPAAVIKVKVALASAYFEMNLNKGTPMDIKIWTKCYDVLLDMMKALRENPTVRLSEDEDVEEHFDDDEEEDGFGMAGIITGQVTQKKTVDEDSDDDLEDGIRYVKGNFYSFLYRLGIELTKSLQSIDPQTPEYVARLRDEPKMRDLCELCAQYYADLGKTSYQCQVVLTQLELEYYHYNAEYDLNLVASGAVKSVRLAKTSPVVAKATFLYQSGDNRQRTRALLCHIFFLSLHNCFESARDLLLMSHVQESINEADIKTRILFNRTMAQLALCAFRTGRYPTAMQCLADLFTSQRIKELLAQGLSSSRYHERDVKQEKIEKKRQYPFHMHMNLDMLESVHLVGAMFSEIDNIQSGKRKIISKMFRRLYDLHKSNFFNAPPENTRDLVMHATKNLVKGYWRKSTESLLSLRMWNLVRDAEYVKSLLVKAVKETSLRMYLLAFGASYMSISMQTLKDTFELPATTITRITSRMMIGNQLDAVWDQPSDSLVMHKTQPTRLQKTALDFAMKATVFVEQNERLLDQRHGYNKGDGKGWNKGRRGKNYGGSSYRRG